MGSRRRRGGSVSLGGRAAVLQVSRPSATSGDTPWGLRCRSRWLSVHGSPGIKTSPPTREYSNTSKSFRNSRRDAGSAHLPPRPRRADGYVHGGSPTFARHCSVPRPTAAAASSTSTKSVRRLGRKNEDCEQPERTTRRVQHAGVSDAGLARQARLHRHRCTGPTARDTALLRGMNCEAGAGT